MDPIASVAQLTARFVAASKPRAEFAVGVEHEKLGVLAADGRTAVPYAGGIEPLFDAFIAEGWTAIREGEHAIALERGAEKLTLEPGGQLELSGAPVKTAHETAAELRAHLVELGARSQPLGIRWLGLGFRPFGTREVIGWVPKGRYVIMREVLAARGRLAHDMMKRTATVQANLDWADADDAARKFRVAMGVSSLVTALWACSPIVEGKDIGYQSYRARVWLETDPDRCGILPFAFTDGDLFAAYTEWALDVPMLFVYRGGYLPSGGMTFRRFLRDGWQGERATVADWDLHLSTLFPEARLKHYLEVRGADAGPVGHIMALPALWRGLLYDDDASAHAIALTAAMGFSDRLRLRETVPREGLAAEVPGMKGRRVGDLARELVAIARAGLVRLGAGEESFLDPIVEIAESGRTAADRVRDAFAAVDGDPLRFADAVALV